MSDFDNIRRMCRSFKDCEGCLVGAFNGKVYGCSTDPSDPNSVWFAHWDKVKPLVDHWIEEHPVKTYLMDFKEKFPNGSLCRHSSFYKGYPANDKDALDALCRCNIYGDSEKKCFGFANCKDCWDMEMEELK